MVWRAEDSPVVPVTTALVSCEGTMVSDGP
jgi:hypothetical protein